VSRVDDAADQAMLDLEALAGAGVELDVELVDEVLKARVMPEIARMLAPRSEELRDHE
jgi:hypothetical protein